ncbi:hypothetical protein NKI19_31925, partial [Mesorhizobium sp. M0751]|uniref:hypothetical protein n=1 Tax=Mesorhizobium sp. M0751 TaxID=2956992 RepID=UPI003338DA96
VLTQNRDDLLFRKPLSLHQSVLQSRPDSNLRWRKLPVAGHSRADHLQQRVAARRNGEPIRQKAIASRLSPSRTVRRAFG